MDALTPKNASDIQANLVPYVIEQTSRGERSFDIFSRLLNERVVFLTGEVNEVSASLIIAQMLHLESVDPSKDINFYINSPGGSVNDGLAIYDTMQFIKSDVSTICVGQCASMGAVLLAAGTPGKRYALPHSRVLIHQPHGGMQGQAADIAIQAQEMQRTREELNRILAQHTGQTIKRINEDTDRDNIMTAKAAVDYGLIDAVIENHASIAEADDTKKKAKKYCEQCERRKRQHEKRTHRAGTRWTEERCRLWYNGRGSPLSRRSAWSAFPRSAS